jgi:hypothetical protein
MSPINKYNTIAPKSLELIRVSYQLKSKTAANAGVALSPSVKFKPFNIDRVFHNELVLAVLNPYSKAP